jgi:ABC-2 type transport system ATP-binding protein
MLSIENVSKTYPNGVQALRELSLEIPAGMFGLLGPNGAGKSTLMRTLATLQEADSGKITMDGLDVLENKEGVRSLLGYLPQEFGLYPRISAEVLLRHLAVLKGYSDAKQRDEAVEALLQRTNLWDARKRKLGTFSGGMRQRFGIAQALLGNPRLIIVDEPTAGLDPDERRRFLNLLSEIGEKAVVILSTHIVADVRELCEELAIVDGGEVLVTGKPEDLVARLDGKIWSKIVAKSELDRNLSSQTVLSTHLISGRIAVRLYSDEQPAEGFESVPANLEDVYFAALRGVPADR